MDDEVGVGEQTTGAGKHVTRREERKAVKGDFMMSVARQTCKLEGSDLPQVFLPGPTSFKVYRMSSRENM